MKLGEGPVLGLGAAVSGKLNGLLEDAAKRKKIKLQYELYTGSTGTDGDRIRFTGKGVLITLVSLPLRYMHAPVETASLKDMEDEIALLTEFIEGLTGKEELRPVEI